MNIYKDNFLIKKIHIINLKDFIRDSINCKLSIKNFKWKIIKYQKNIELILNRNYLKWLNQIVYKLWIIYINVKK